MLWQRVQQSKGPEGGAGSGVGRPVHSEQGEGEEGVARGQIQGSAPTGSPLDISAQRASWKSAKDQALETLGLFLHERFYSDNWRLTCSYEE